MENSIYLIGLSHRTADVATRERYAPCRWDETALPILPLKGAITESLTLSTCNRVEILAVAKQDPGDPVRHILEHWASHKGSSAEDLAPYVYVLRDQDAVRHLFSVASSLDSMVLGEPQILGQIKEAYRTAVSQGATGPILNRLLHKAFSVAKRVRTETAVASSAVSISYAAVELAKRIFGEMRTCRAMLIGAGKMAELAALHLASAGVQHILVANRTYANAVSLANRFHGDPIPFDALFARLTEADIIISSTGAPEPLIRAQDVRGVLKQRKHRPMFFIDIAVPRDVDPEVNSLDNVYLYDIDDLSEVVEENKIQRREEAAKAWAIVDDETRAFGNWLSALQLQPTIVALLQHGEHTAHKELSRTLKRLGPDVDDRTREALESLACSLVKKLYHDPIAILKQQPDEDGSAKEWVDMVRRLFNLDDLPLLANTPEGLCSPSPDGVDDEPQETGEESSPADSQ